MKVENRTAKVTAFCFQYSRATIVAVDHFTVSDSPELWPTEVVFDVFLLILESLGSTELFFILIMALVFFGPRKLPQLSRSLGKNLAEFRRASEDFKRTWEREVALEDLQSEPVRVGSSSAQENSILDPLVVEPPPDQVVARESGAPYTSLPSETTENETNTIPEAPRKQDWL